MWEAIRRNKRHSLLLVALLTGLLAAVGVSVGAAWGAADIGLAAAFGLSLVLALTTWYGGDRIVLWASDCREVSRDEAPQLFNVVEEMSIASGLPMPKICIIEDSAPNAFATGRTPKSATVAVTRGLLDKLSRDELQGVIAHEMGHIRNRDTLYLTLVGVLVGTLVLICDLYLRATWHGAHGGRRRVRAGPAGAVLVLVALVLAIVAPILARLLHLAVSRRREYLADATAVEFTRYPEGLASALEKIAEDREVLEVANRATAHLYIVNPIKPTEERYSALGSTHPPIRERIAILRAMSTGATLRDYEETRMALGAGPRRPLASARALAESAGKRLPLREAPPAAKGRPLQGPDPKGAQGQFGRMAAAMAASAAQVPRTPGPGEHPTEGSLVCECGSRIPRPPGRPGIVECMKCGKLHDLRRAIHAAPPGAAEGQTHAEAPGAGAGCPPPAAGSALEPHATRAGHPPRRDSSRGRTAVFEAKPPAAGVQAPAPEPPAGRVEPVSAAAPGREGQDRPSASEKAEPPILQERKMLKVDWAKSVGPVRGPTATVSRPPAVPPAGQNPFGIRFDARGEPIYPAELVCPHCAAHFPTPEGFKGSRGPCPSCGAMIVFFERT